MDPDHPTLSARSLSLLILGQRVCVECCDAAVTGTLRVKFGAMVAPALDVAPDLQYWVEQGGTPSSYALIRQGGERQDATDLAGLVFALEKDITIELQRRRSELLFLHAAAIDYQGSAFLLAAESGSGKSTTAWALLHHGFRYLSDELAPVDMSDLRVFPYSQALCLKQDPPPAYALPASVIRLGNRIHVPTAALPSPTSSGPRPLAAVFLVRYRPGLGAPELNAIDRAEASARLYVTALNPLAHPGCGLDAAVRICEQVPCFTIASAELPATCALLRAAVEQVFRTRVETTPR